MIDLFRQIRQLFLLHQNFLHLKFFLEREFIVALFHMDLPTFCVNVVHDLRKLFPGHCQHLDQKRRRIDSVFSIDVTVYGQTAGRLSSDDGSRLLHLG